MRTQIHFNVVLVSRLVELENPTPVLGDNSNDNVKCFIEVNVVAKYSLKL